MNEVNIITNKMNHLIDPSLTIWAWEVPVYLFFGGLAAGTMIISSLVHYFGKEKEYPNAAGPLAILGPILLSLGMGALFMDLEYKLHVFRFYTTFKITSPMSWGSWILVLYYPVGILMILGVIKKSFPNFYKSYLDEFMQGSGFLNRNINSLRKWCEKNMKLIAMAGLPAAIALGIYTGILLSGLGARPFWNASIWGPIFLTSGFSTALALNLIMTKNKHEEHMSGIVDIIAILFELVMLLLFVINMLSGATIKREAINLILGGPYTHHFWIFVIVMGLLFPLLLETLELKGKRFPKYLAPVLVLIGGLVFRFVVVNAGQMTTWIHY